MSVELPKGEKQMIKCREGCADFRKVYEPFDKDATCAECHNTLIALLESSKSTRPHHQVGLISKEQLDFVICIKCKDRLLESCVLQ